jgi:hypothetical protein
VSDKYLYFNHKYYDNPEQLAKENELSQAPCPEV